MDSNEPDLFGQLPSASENPSRKQSSENTGPKSRSTTTLEPSQRMNLRESTSSAEDFHASPGPSPGSSEAQKMTVTSGQRWLPLLKSYGRRSLSDLESIGYQCVTFILPACATGAPHRRDRVWIVGNASDERRNRRSQKAGREGSQNFAEQSQTGFRSEPGGPSSYVADAERRGRQGSRQPVNAINPTAATVGEAVEPVDGGFREIGCAQPGMGGVADGVSPWLDEPDIGRVATGVKNRSRRLKALGNAVVPQVVEQIGKAILNGTIK